MANEFDFIAIGDVVTDAFIRLKDASVHCDINREHCMISMRFADKIPYEEVYVIPAVGNSANAAFSAARLGLKTAFVSNIGSDAWGTECLDALNTEHIETKFVKANAGKKTNYHYVLWYEDDRTILIKHEDYDYQLPDIGSPKWVYVSSAGEKSMQFHQDLEKYVTERPEVKLAFQPGTFQMKNTDALLGLYKRTDLFICNKEEYQRILKTQENDVKKLMELMVAMGPKLVVLTDGPKGAYLREESGEFWFMPPYPDPKPPFERTGAGDAFSSTLTAALALGMSPQEAIMWGPINSMSVVQYVGAREGLLSREKLEEYLKNAPADYKPKKI
jgi:ribokinase